MTFRPEPTFRHGQPPRTAVLLVNLGTPDEPTPRALRRYLAEFLSDPRVVEIPRAVWWPILHGIILNTRPAKSAAKYATVQLGFQLPFMLKLGLLGRPRWRWGHEGVKRIGRLMLPAIFGSSVSQVALLLDTLIASFLATGSIAWLYYADRRR